MMFNTDNPQAVAAKIEAQMRKELDSNQPLAFRIETNPDFLTSVGGISTLREAFSAFLNQTHKHLFTVRLDLNLQRRAEAFVRICQTAQKYVAADQIIYLADLGENFHGSAALGTDGQFVGDVEVANKLNGARDLAKAAANFPTTKMQIGEVVFTLPPFVGVAADGESVTLAARTLPELKWFGLRSSFKAKEFLELAKRFNAF
jgi:hypothetical protein